MASLKEGTSLSKLLDKDSSSSAISRLCIVSEVNDSRIPTNLSCPPVISEEERRQYLDILQENTTLAHIPILIFLSLVLVVGLSGNTLVLLVYSRKARRNSTDIFIMVMAVFDLMTNVAAIPGEIYNLLNFWDFDNHRLCAFRLFLNSFTTLTSAFILMAVAADRYNKICRPFKKQMSVRTAQILSWSSILVAAIFATPHAILNGVQTQPTPKSNIFSKECSIDDKYVLTVWPLVYVGLQALLFISACSTLIGLYTCIGIQAWRHRKGFGVPSDDTPNTSGDTDGAVPKKFKSNPSVFRFLGKKSKYDNYPMEENPKDPKECQDCHGPSHMQNINKEKNASHDNLTKTISKADGHHKDTLNLSTRGIDQINPSDNGRLKATPEKSTKSVRRQVLTRTNLMLLTISAVFVIAFVPHICLISSKYAVSDFLENMSYSELAAYNVFLRFYFINSAANAVIYSLCDNRFRQNVFKLFICRR